MPPGVGPDFLSAGLRIVLFLGLLAPDAPAQPDPDRTTSADAPGADLRSAIAAVRPAYVRLQVEHRPTGVDLQSRTGRATLTSISGLLIDDRGHVLTMGDALIEADLVSAETEDGEITLCDVVGYDPETAVGVVRLVAPREAAFAVAPAAEVEPGLPVFSLGNPFGLGTTVTAGHVTGVDRTIDVRGVEMGGLLQVSMAMNPGDQGGPIADAEGRILGVMLTRYLGQPEVTSTVEPQGISFALPIEAALGVARRMIEAYAAAAEPPTGDRPWVGVRVRPIEDDVLKSQLRLAPEQGILVERVFRGSPAMNAGLRMHDVVVRFGAEPVRGLQHFGGLVRSLDVGEQIELVVVRGGEQRTLRLVVGAR
ncbi:MAG: S1C family serine protease [Planctomycetota bacterium JB042]